MGDFAVIKTEIVGPKVGRALQRQAISATLYALGVDARLYWLEIQGRGLRNGSRAGCLPRCHCRHWFFSLFDKDISSDRDSQPLLTLVGYSTNDTIVIFDRIRENLKNPTATNLSSRWSTRASIRHSAERS